MPKERNRADDYREKAYAGDTKAMNRSSSARLLPKGRKNLGVCYERGTGVKVDLEMAFQWYMKAAELGDVYGCFNVGECYYHGKGVEQDVRLAFEWYMKAADKGIFSVRRTSEPPIGMAMVWRRTWRNAGTLHEIINLADSSLLV